MNNSLQIHCLSELVETCLEGAKHPLTVLEMFVVPITQENLSYGFLDAAQARLPYHNARRADAMKTFRRAYYLLPHYRPPKSVTGNQSLAKGRFTPNNDLLCKHLISTQINRVKKEFGVVLETCSLRDQIDPVTDLGIRGTLSRGEEAYLEFMNQAGTVLLAHGRITARDAEAAWMGLLVRYLWESGSIKVHSGYATVCDLWTHSLRALSFFAALPNETGDTAWLSRVAKLLESLKGKQRQVLTMLAQTGDPVRIADIAIDKAILWTFPYKGQVDGIKKALNDKLRHLNVRIIQHENCLSLKFPHKERRTRKSAN